MDGGFNLVLGAGFMLGGLLIFLQARRRKQTESQDTSKEFIPARWSPKSLRFGAIGLFLLGILMVMGQHFHLI